LDRFLFKHTIQKHSEDLMGGFEPLPLSDPSSGYASERQGLYWPAFD